jgi:hypothetical protein
VKARLPSRASHQTSTGEKPVRVTLRAQDKVWKHIMKLGTLVSGSTGHGSPYFKG